MLNFVHARENEKGSAIGIATEILFWWLRQRSHQKRLQWKARPLAAAVADASGIAQIKIL